MNYYLWNNSQEKGPFSDEEIQAAIRSGEINRGQPARTEDSSDWKPLEQIVELERLAQSGAAPAPAKKFPFPPPGVVSGQTRPQAYLAHIRANSCYLSLRGIIEVLFILSLIAVACYGFLALIAAARFTPLALGALLICGLQVILLIAARHFFLLLIDIADTLLFQHSKDRGD